MYVYFVRLTSYQLNTLYPQQLVTLTLDSTCHPSWRTWHSYRTTWSQHSQRHLSATSVQPFFLVSSWGCSTPRNTELPTPTIVLSSSRHDDSRRRNPRADRHRLHLTSSSLVLASTRSKASVTRLHVYTPSQDPAPTHRELHSLTQRRSSIRHCQSTSYGPATEPYNATHQPFITIVDALLLAYSASLLIVRHSTSLAT